MLDFFGNTRSTTFVILRDLGFDREFAERVCRDRLGKAEIEFPDVERSASEVQQERNAGQRGKECFNGNSDPGRSVDLHQLFGDLTIAGYVLGFAGVIGRVQAEGKTRYLVKAVYYSPAEVARLTSLGSAQALAEATEDSGKQELRSKTEWFLCGKPCVAAHGHHNPDDSFSVFIPQLKDLKGSALRQIRFVDGRLFTEERPAQIREALKAPLETVARRNRGDDVSRGRADR